MMARVTLKTIAVETGFSVTTVSRALAGYDDVSERTREIVRETAERLGYYPNMTARQLQSQRTQTVGFVLPNVNSQFEDPFFTRVVAGICDVLAAHQYDLLLIPMSSGEGEAGIYQRLVRGHRVDGLLLNHGRRQDERVAYLSEHEVPFVLFGRTELALDYPYIDVDGSAATYRLTQHLIGLGHQRLAYLALPQHFTHGRARYMGFQQALMENGLSFPRAYFAVGDFTEASAEPFVSHLLGLDEPPTAIVAANDLMALGVLNSVKKHGLTPGKDIAVAGFDDIPTAHIFGLTTIHQPIYDIGQRMAAMLMQLLAGGGLEERHIMVQPRLIVRSSTA